MVEHLQSPSMVPSILLEVVSCGVQTVWQDLEVENEMSRGLLPGLVVLSGKLGPTLRTTTQRTLHSVAQVQLAWHPPSL